MMNSYLKNILQITQQGDAREESYYGTLEKLLDQFARKNQYKAVKITTLPKKTEAGNPDFRVWDGTQHIIGYIEAKAPTVSDLDHVEESGQLQRYRQTFPNLILTNFFEFRLFRHGMLIDKVRITRPFVIQKLLTLPPVENQVEFFKLLQTFFDFSLPKIQDSKTLAVELAKRTRFLKDEVITEELKEEEKGRGFILSFYEAFKKYLINGLTKADFADLYSQTITYGLFAARTRAKNGFNRKLAYDNIPQTIGILRDVFQFISLGSLPHQMEWIIDDISEILTVTDVHQLLHDYYHEGKGRDPIIHFYETFLAEYDPEVREKRGVYYTPEPVVTYIVNSLNHVLKTSFNKAEGLANDLVTVLDPAAGTLTFIAEAARLAIDEFIARFGEGGKENFIKDHVLQNFYAFELMMAPYAIGHLKMSFLLEESGFQLHRDERFQLYLTNSLEMEDLAQTQLPGMASLSDESHLAAKVKKEQPILVILGNPPYSGHSANRGEWIDKLLKKGYAHKNGHKDNGFYQVDGKPLGEKNPKWLQDDYVKFIRFAQWKIDQAGEGVLGFITNHSYLDNPTFRGMRQSLLKSFNKIYILDLHGNSLKKERCPDGSKDENVFDIRQGVAIALFIKFKDKTNSCEVFHSEIWGLRERKYDWLNSHNISNTQWKKLLPKTEFYFFIPRNENLFKFYMKSPKINEIFPVNSVGIVTARDNLTIKWTPQEVWTTFLNFSKMDQELARRTFDLGKDTRDWKIEFAQKDIIESGLDRNKIVPILYRPFDIRYTYYTGKSRGFLCMPRSEVMQHLLRTNLALCIGRAGQVVGLESNWNIVFCSKYIEDFNLFYRGGNVNFPLYLYSDAGNSSNNNRRTSTMVMVFDTQEPYLIRKPNISQVIYDQLTSFYNIKPTPEQIFYYIYAVLYSNHYRTIYAEFLKVDFPRIPFARDHSLFQKMGEHGERLVDLHLLQSSELDPPITKYQGKGDNKIETTKYDDRKGRVYVNPGQYFENIRQEIWNYQIGGYQICEKWLKDRKGRVLTLDEIKHYCGITTAIQKTIEIQNEIDKIYSEVEKQLIEF